MKYFRRTDVSKIPFPAVIDPADPEKIKDEMISDFEKELRESGKEGFSIKKYDPMYHFFCVAASKIASERNKINHAVKNRFVTLSSGKDLEANVFEGVLEQRKPGESDEELADRYFQAVLGEIPNGTDDAYTFQVLKKISGEYGSESVADCRTVSEAPGEVRIVVLPLVKFYRDQDVSERTPEGEREKIRKKIENHFKKNRDVSPVSDLKIVQISGTVPVNLKIKIEIKEGPGEAEIIRGAEERLNRYAKSLFKIGAVLEESRLKYEVMDDNILSCEIISPETGSKDPGPLMAIDVVSKEVVVKREE